MQSLLSLQKLFSNYVSFDEKEWQLFIELSKIKHINKGDFFVKEGEKNSDFGVIISGCMRYFYLKNGEEFTGEFWQENEIIGSYEGLILNQPSTLFIEAIEDCSIVTLSYPKMKELSLEIKKLDKVIVAILEKFLVESQRRIASYITETAEERYLRLRREMPGIEDRVHQKYIASFVGVTPVTLSRIRSRLAKKR